MDTKNQPVVDSLTPVGFRVLVNVYQKDNQTSSGHWLPESENTGMPALAQISVLGKKTVLQKILLFLGLRPRYKVGQWVYFRKYSVDTLQINTPDGDLTLYVLEENEIIGEVNGK